MKNTHKNKNQWRWNFTVLSVIIFLFGVQGLSAQTLGGPTSVEVDNTYNYFIYHTGVTSSSWSASGGTVMGSSTTSASIRWDQVGSMSVSANFSDAYNSFYRTLNVTVSNAPPAAPSNPTIATNGCGGATLQRSGTPPSGVTWYWQGKSSSGTDINKGSGSTFTVNEGDGTYYIRARNSTGEWSTSSGSVAVTIADLTGGTITGTQTICHGANSPSMGSSAAAGGTEGIYSYQWEYSSFDSGGWVPISGAQAEGYAPSVSLTADRSYRRKVTCGTQTAYSNTVNITVHPLVLAPGVTSGERCGTGTVQLSASPGSNADEIRWYSALTGGSEITTGVSGDTFSFTTPVLTTNTTYYAESYDSGTGCFSGTRTAVQATMNPVPGQPTLGTVTQTTCTEANGSFTITNYNASYTYSVSPSTGVTVSGANITAPEGSYSVTATLGTCSSVASVTKTVDAQPTTTLAQPTLSTVTQPTCTVDTGSFTITNYDGSYTYTVSPSPGVIISGANITGPAGYNYTVKATLGTCSSNWSSAAPVDPQPTAPTEAPEILEGSLNPATCLNANGSFQIKDYNGALYTYNISGPSGWSLGGNMVTGPPGVYSVTETTIIGNCTGPVLTVTIANPNPAAPPAPILINPVSPVCDTADGTFEIDNYSAGNSYDINPSVGVSAPYLDAVDNKWKVTAPADTYTVTSTSAGCISTAASITITAVSNPCAASCSITGINPDPINFGSGIHNIPITVEGVADNCTLLVTEIPSWITSYTVQPDNKTINLISEANTLGDMTGTIKVERGSHIMTAVLNRENGSNFPGNPDAPTIDPNDCSQRTLVRVVDSLLPSGETWYWQGNNPNGTSELMGFGETYTIDAEPGTGDLYYIRAKKNGYWSTEATGVYVTIKSAPQDPNAIVSQPQCLTETGTITILNAVAGDEISFDGGLNYGTTTTKTGLAAGDHVIMLRSVDGCVSAGVTATINQAPSVDCGPVTYTGDNYIYSRTYQKEEPGTAAAFFTQDADLIQQITYFDGLGRPEQQIGIDQSPTTGSDWNDIVTHIDYDGYGRQDKEFLPYVATDTDLGTLRSGAETATTTFYNVTKYENTSNPYSQKAFEASPLNLVTRQAAPGDAWKLDLGNDDHSIEFGYLTNTATDNVRQFVLTTNLVDGAYVPTLTFEQDDSSNDIEYYEVGGLYKTVAKDENHSGTTKNHTTEEFKDKQGRVVLKRTYADIDTDGDGTPETEVPHDTYYVYDDFGNLTYVLPPKMEASTANLTDINANMDELGYQYVYDQRNRLVEKKIAGKGWEYIVYNKLDQPIMTQDANQRDTGANPNEWLFTKYDVFGRIAYTGKATDDRSRSAIQTDVDTLIDLWVSQSGTSDTFGDATLNYNDGAYPSNTNSTTTVLTEVLTINYYDTYVDLPTGAPTSVTLLSSTPSEANTTNVKGLATASRVKVLDASASPGQEWINTVTYYDDKVRPVYTCSDNTYLGTTDIVETQLDFVGKPLKSRATHIRNGNTLVTINNFTYDQAGRLLAQTQCIGDETLGDSCSGGASVVADLIISSGTVTTAQVVTNSIVVTNTTLSPGAHLYIDANGSSGMEELIVLNEYDNLGQLLSKKVGGSAHAIDVLQSNGLQQVDYTYNIRGWLKTINEGTTLGTDLFGFKINYNNPTENLGAVALFNGNISETLWETANDDTKRAYGYQYDALNRITDGKYNLDTNYDLSGITYDKMGNIQSLTRRGHTAIDGNGQVTGYGIMDDLSYSYQPNSNKLLKVTDAATIDEFGFKDDALNTAPDSLDDYDYDDNGNMTADTNKGITSITYNHLNLPTQVTINSDNITYIYDALGTKLKKTVTEGSSVTTEYAGNYIYENNSLQMFGTDEGYVQPKNVNDYSQGFDYIYEYKDHLGNVRLSYTDADNNRSIDASSEIVQERNYYPFGLEHKGYNGTVSSLGNSVAKKYKYQGQELDESLGYNMYEFELRHYDAAIGRFVTTDPYEQFDSPYVAMGNNPVVSFDPNGGYCYDSNGNQIACPNDAGDLYDDYKDSETNHINILDAFTGTPQDSNSVDETEELGTRPIIDNKFPSIQELAGLDHTIAEIEMNITGERTVETRFGDVKVDAAGNLVRGPVQGGSGAIGLAGGPASGMKVIRIGTKEWKAAVQSLRNLKKANIRVPSIAEAKALIKEAFGNVNRVRRYKKLPNGSPQATKRYEVHNLDNINKGREIGVGNDLNHVKYTNGKQSGHIYFGN